jgi:hypothetical protein
MLEEFDDPRILKVNDSYDEEKRFSYVTFKDTEFIKSSGFKDIVKSNTWHLL